MIAAPMRLLTGLLGFLAVVLVLEWVWPSGSDATGPVAALRLGHSAPKASLQSRAVNEWAETALARPLFTISRRPPKVEAAGPNEAAPDDMRLAGILIGRFGRRAIFAPGGGGKPVVLAEGAAVNASTIRSITPSQVILASGTVLSPSFDKNRVPPSPYLPAFQPVMPNFPQPGFTPGQMPQPGFPIPRMPQAPEPNEPGVNAQPDAPPVPGIPVFRGPMIPQRRE